MNITVNKKAMELINGATLSGLFKAKGLDEKKVLAALNGQIIKADDYPETVLKAGDEVELFSFVSGG